MASSGVSKNCLFLLSWLIMFPQVGKKEVREGRRRDGKRKKSLERRDADAVVTNHLFPSMSIRKKEEASVILFPICY